MFSEAKNTKQQGTVGLGAAISHYTSKMHIVSVPLNDGQDYDLIVDKGGLLHRVSVKTTRYVRNGKFVALLSMQGGNRKKNYIGKYFDQMRFDYLFILTSEGTKYEIPKECLQGVRRSLVLSWKWEKFRVS